MPDILVTENIVGVEMDALRRDFDVAFEPDLWKTPELLRQRVADCRAIIVRNQTKVDEALIAAGRKLQVIGRAGVGLENVNHAAATKAGIVVAYAPSQNTISVAELTLGLMISLARTIPAADRSTKAGGWERQLFTGTELYGKTLGVVGLGKIGYMTACRARAFGMDIVVHDPIADPDSFTVTELRAPLLSREALYARADFVTVHVPETPQTIGMFNDAAFEQMKTGAYFINTARGRVVDEAALGRAIRSKKLAGAALDVREVEPPTRDGPLADLENVILTPHIAAFTREGQKRVVASVCADVASVLRGTTARNFFNFATPRAETPVIDVQLEKAAKRSAVRHGERAISA